MKFYCNYKAYLKFLLLGILLIIPIVFSSAQTAQEIRNKINEKDSAIEKLEKEIASYQSQIDGLVQQKDYLLLITIK